MTDAWFWFKYGVRRRINYVRFHLIQALMTEEEREQWWVGRSRPTQADIEEVAQLIIVSRGGA